MRSAGEVVLDAAGRHCFLPAVPTAPAMDVVWPAVAAAGEAVQAFDRAVAAFPVPGLLGGLFARFDAVQSSRVEGTTTTFDELIAFQATRRAPDPADAESVAGVADAWAAMGAAGAGPLAAARLAHARIFARARPADLHGAAPGDVKVATNATPDPDAPGGFFHFTPPEHLPRALDAWERFSLATDGMPELVRAALSHWMFEHIHPFHDGNGRIGRLLIPVMLCAKGVTGTPSAFCGEAVQLGRTEYREGLRRARREADWGWWTRLMLGFVERTAIANRHRLARLAALHDDWRRATRVHRADSAIHALADLVLARPTLTAREAAGALAGRRSYQAVLTALAALEALGIVARTDGTRRNRLWVAPAVLALFARPDPAPAPIAGPTL